MTNQPNWTMRAPDGGAIARPPETMRPQIIPTVRILRDGTERLINESDFNADTDERIKAPKASAAKAARATAAARTSKPKRRNV